MSESDAKAAAAGVPEAREDAETFAVQQLRPMEERKWNEGRLDDLNKRVDDGIGRLDDERKEFRGEMRAGFEAVEKRFEKVDEEFRAVREEMNDEFTAVRGELKAGFDRMQWWLIGAASAVIVAFIGGPHL
jgi:hypothetical protein